MIFNNLPDEVIVIHPSKGADEYGNPVLEFAAHVNYELTKGWLQREQGTGSESAGQERSTSRTTFRLYLPADTKVDARDRVEIGGSIYTIETDPILFRGINGKSHITARLRKLVG